jgi:hypothetical protein
MTVKIPVRYPFVESVSLTVTALKGLAQNVENEDKIARECSRLKDSAIARLINRLADMDEHLQAVGAESFWTFQKYAPAINLLASG